MPVYKPVCDHSGYVPGSLNTTELKYKTAGECVAECGKLSGAEREPRYCKDMNDLIGKIRTHPKAMVYMSNQGVGRSINTKCGRDLKPGEDIRDHPFATDPDCYDWCSWNPSKCGQQFAKFCDKQQGSFTQGCKNIITSDSNWEKKYVSNCAGTTKIGDQPGFLVYSGCPRWCKVYPKECAKQQDKYCSENPNAAVCQGWEPSLSAIENNNQIEKEEEQQQQETVQQKDPYYGPTEEEQQQETVQQKDPYYESPEEEQPYYSTVEEEEQQLAAANGNDEEVDDDEKIPSIWSQYSIYFIIGIIIFVMMIILIIVIVLATR